MAAARVVVLGAGIVGATAAWQLASRGVRVDLVESGETGRATSAGAGIVQPWRPAATRSWAAYSDLAAAGYPQLAADLAAGGHDSSYAMVGGLTVSRDLAGLRAMAEDLAADRPTRAQSRGGGAVLAGRAWAGLVAARWTCWRRVRRAPGSRCSTRSSPRYGPPGSAGSTGGCSAG